MMDKIKPVRDLVNSESYSVLIAIGAVNPMLQRNLNLVEHYLALKASGVPPLKAVKDTAKMFRCKQRWVYKIKSDFGV